MSHIKISLWGTLGQTYYQTNNDLKKLRFQKIVLEKAQKNHGLCSFLGKKLIAIFSYNKKNYLYLENKTIEISPNIDFECYCEESEQTSWIKVYDHAHLIYELHYKNNTEPTGENAWDFYIGDWELNNFASYIRRYIERIKQNPNIILFSNQMPS